MFLFEESEPGTADCWSVAVKPSFVLRVRCGEDERSEEKKQSSQKYVCMQSILETHTVHRDEHDMAGGITMHKGEVMRGGTTACNVREVNRNKP